MPKIKVYNVLCTGSRIPHLFRYTQYRDEVLYNLSNCILSTENEEPMIACLTNKSALYLYRYGTGIGHDILSI